MLFEDGPLGDVLLLGVHRAARGAAAAPGHRRRDRRAAVVGRDPRDGRYLRRARLPYTWRDPEHAEDPEAAALLAALTPEELPLVRLPGGTELRGPAAARSGARSASAPSWRRARRSTSSIVGGGPAGLGAAVYGASEGLDTLVIESTALGGQAGASRRIENYLGFPAGISGAELTTRAVTQARKFGARMATPYRARRARAGRRPPRRAARRRGGDRRARRGARHRRRVPPAAGRRPRGLRGHQRLLRRRPARGSALRRRPASPSSAAATRPRRPRSGSPAAARS